MNNNELCVPASAVAVPADADSQDGPTAPAAGDEVEVTVRGTVSRIEGGNVYLQPTSANGEPLPDGGPGHAMDEGAEGADAMDSMVAKEKERMGYV